MAQPGRKRAARPAPAEDSGATAGGVSAAYLLLGVGLLVFVVSMPRFRAHVVRENTAEARESLLLVGEIAYEQGGSDLPALLRQEAYLRHRLRDARPSAASGRLAHHGYLMDDALLPDGERVLAAWPLEYGRTGRDAWAVTRDGRLWRHSNRGEWSGEARPLRFVSLEGGWVEAEPPQRRR